MRRLGHKVAGGGFDVTEFHEPDFGGALTAICVGPGPGTRKLRSGLPLAGKHPADPWYAERERRMRFLAQQMRTCEQAPGLTVEAHGASVWAHLRSLLGHLRGCWDLNHRDHEETWRLPGWVGTYRDLLRTDLADDLVLERYTRWHDVGKPFCRTVDEDGRQHFPDHAAGSAKLWAAIWDRSSTADELWATTGDVALFREALAAYEPVASGDADVDRVGRLIGADMDVHLLRSETLDEFASRPDAVSLLLAGVAEIHSNAAMFGGIGSTSFKIKWKHLDRRGRQILERRARAA